MTAFAVHGGVGVGEGVDIGGDETDERDEEGEDYKGGHNSPGLKPRLQAKACSTGGRDEQRGKEQVEIARGGAQID
ncbi:MAG: hypothetical protein JO307_21280 [Bryobacterales bacterium]|nr:hypothetical protein [Bryobacterales bacterium]MBV9397303.1 hypothetical protein [Bryobacterales bacterium]